MILYHGSYLEVKKPDVGFSRDKLDFGRGFYLTPIKEQAVNWTTHFFRKHSKRVVSVYEFDEAIDLRLLNFPEYSEDWLDFITLCRLGIGNNGQYDLIIGSVANDRPAFNQEVIDKSLHFISSEVIV